MLHAGKADWGVFECDELWLAKILPHLQADYVLLLNLFRDQLDRFGEIDRIQATIAEALAKTPETTFVFNGDVRCARPLPTAFPTNRLRSASRVTWAFPPTAFPIAVSAKSAAAPWNMITCTTASSAPIVVPIAGGRVPSSLLRRRMCVWRKTASCSISMAAACIRGTRGAYMVYNLAAVSVAASLLGCTNEALQKAVDAFDPQNGRLQTYDLAGRRVLLNLAKNPTGFNQNLKIVAQDQAPKVVAFFINDKEADGRDVSWLWDIDFDQLNAPQVQRIILSGRYCNDLAERFSFTDIPREKVTVQADIPAAAAELKADGSENVYVVTCFSDRDKILSQVVKEA